MVRSLLLSSVALLFYTFVFIHLQVTRISSDNSMMECLCIDRSIDQASILLRALISLRLSFPLSFAVSFSLFRFFALSLLFLLSPSVLVFTTFCILPQSLPMTLSLFGKCSLAFPVFHLIILYHNPYIKVRCIFEYRFKFSTQFPNTNYCSQKDGCF